MIRMNQSFDEMTKEEGIKTVYGGYSHVVILGAGASIAATRHNPERSGKKLPSMDDFIEVVGLKDVLGSATGNFEAIYSHLYDEDPESAKVKEVESRVWDYFADLRLPVTPTIYDYLILSLRSKDLIATFNWDPFLFQAYSRVVTIIRKLGIANALERTPFISYLHGSVAVGYSEAEKRGGPVGDRFPATPLLYPVTHKVYNQHPAIIEAWDKLRCWLEDAKRVTIFGYGAPVTDVEAVDLMSLAWGAASGRNMEQFEILDIQPREVLRERWSRFIHTHHYQCADNYFKSTLATFPRRTGERFMHQFMPSTPGEAFQEPNPIPPTFSSVEALVRWHFPLFEAEYRHGRESCQSGFSEPES
jgi:hypothetical protein